MRLRDSDGGRVFRQELRAWLDDAVPSLPPEPPPDDWAARRARDTAWQRLLHDAGYAGITWPTAYGGRGAGAAEQFIYLEESQRAGAPHLGVNFVGMLHAGPTLFTEGTPAQQRFHLPPILRGEHVWCQGFSEPGAGSDLASLRTRAVRDGDHYVVSGQKIWTSWGHVADYCELLVRTSTDGSKHQGITWLILDMASPGVEVRPLRTANGTTEFCELFLDEVRVPVANRVGDEHDGWRVSMVTFGFERGGAVVTEMMRSRQIAQDLLQLVGDLGRSPGQPQEDGALRRELGHVLAEFDGLWALARSQASVAERGRGSPYDGSVFKIAYAEAIHRLSDVTVRLLGRAALVLHDPVEGGDPDQHARVRQLEHAIWALSVSISAGTTQIQRNIVAERLLGLPREPVWTSR